MAELVPAQQTPINNAASAERQGPWNWQRLTALMQQPAVKRSLPAIGAIGAIAMAGLAYLTIASGPQRVLYSSLTDGERANVVEALEQGGISFTIDPATGMVWVAEDQLYQARMLVASNAGLATPESATDMLDAIPLGTSRTMEGERLRLARERELMLTIKEIDGITSARVHLATPERSVFVRERTPPSASVMVRLARGRTLGENQVNAIVNLVAGSVPGLSGEAVRVVDQNGRLLSTDNSGALDGLLLQREFEAKLRDQLSQLLTPLLGEGNFSTEVQVQLEQAEVTAARESYEREGAIRSESETTASRVSAGSVGGVPGVLANTPPPPAELVEEAPQGDQDDEGQAAARDRESSLRRDYELGREVSVSSTAPGALSRLSVAVAVSAAALEKVAPADEAKIASLVEAAVGADANRGDVVTVVTGNFEAPAAEDVPFYETTWFGMALRYGGGLLVAILLLLFGVRPLIKRLRAADASEGRDAATMLADEAATAGNSFNRSLPNQFASADGGQDNLPQQIELARKLAKEQPDRAVAALQRMLAPPAGDEAAT